MCRAFVFFVLVEKGGEEKKKEKEKKKNRQKYKAFSLKLLLITSTVSIYQTDDMASRCF